MGLFLGLTFISPHSFSQATPFGVLGVVLKRTKMFVFVVVGHYARSPRIRLANWISLGMMVTRFAWMAHRLVSLNSPTR